MLFLLFNEVSLQAILGVNLLIGSAKLIALAFVASWFITGLKRYYSVTHGLLDVPNKRSSHTIPTPSGGGIGIVFTFLGIMLWLFLNNEITSVFFIVIFVGGILISGIGMLDDYKPLPALWRLAIHILAFGLAFYLLGTISNISLGKVNVQVTWIGNIFFFIGFVWFLNLFNFMDGIDGMAGIEAVSTLGCGTVILYLLNGSSSEYFPLIILGAAICGFLIWNWPPAKIFMGDVGSGFLGYIIGVFVLQTTANEIITLWSWLILFGVFLIDASVTLFVRFFHFEKVYQAHCSHAYQRAARKYKSHKKVTITVLKINLFWLFPLALGAAFHPNWGLILTIISYIPLVFLTLKLGAGKQGYRS